MTKIYRYMDIEIKCMHLLKWNTTTDIMTVSFSIPQINYKINLNTSNHKVASLKVNEENYEENECNLVPPSSTQHPAPRPPTASRIWMFPKTTPLLSSAAKPTSITLHCQNNWMMEEFRNILMKNQFSSDEHNVGGEHLLKTSFKVWHGPA